MSKKEYNKIIIEMIREKIAERRLTDVLDVYPIENTFQRRQKYWTDGNVHLFKVHMWDLNCLSGDELYNEIELRINEAIKYFGLG